LALTGGVLFLFKTVAIKESFVYILDERFLACSIRGHPMKTMYDRMLYSIFEGIITVNSYY
jgi:hypothetical protein